MARPLSILFAAIISLALMVSPALAQDGDSSRPTGWNETSHGKSTEPDYAVVFPQDEVNILTITIDPENWQAMLDTMTELYGEFGARQDGNGQRPFNGERPGGFEPGQMLPEGVAPGQMPAESVAPPNMGERPGGMGVGGMMGGSENPIWVPADITFGGQKWTDVGIRFKGNSSLMSILGERKLETAVQAGLRPVRGRIPGDRRPALLRLQAA